MSGGSAETDQVRCSSISARLEGSDVVLSTWAEGLGSREFWLTRTEARTLARGLTDAANSHFPSRPVKDDPRA